LHDAFKAMLFDPAQVAKFEQQLAYLGSADFAAAGPRCTR
jgi:hypothetical protein